MQATLEKAILLPCGCDGDVLSRRSCGFQKFHVTSGTSGPCRNRLGLRTSTGPATHISRIPTCAFCFRHSSGRSFFMFRKTLLPEKGPWTTLLVASAALGLACYYAHARQPTTESDLKPSQVDEQQCQDTPASDIDRFPNTMDAEERAYHERFMREAIAMVNHTRHTLFAGLTVHSHGTMLTHPLIGRTCTEE